MPDIMLILYKNNAAYDISSLVEKIVWKGRKGSAARSLSVELAGDAGIDATRGDSFVFSFKGGELFRGLIMSYKKTEKMKFSVTAYDNGIYLANNKDTFVYSNRTLHDIFIDVCKRFELKYGSVASTFHKIPELTKSKTTEWEVISGRCVYVIIKGIGIGIGGQHTMQLSLDMAN